jgi:hypothetical protein
MLTLESTPAKQQRHFRSRLQTGRNADIAEPTALTQGGHNGLLNYTVGQGENGPRDSEAMPWQS